MKPTRLYILGCCLCVLSGSALAINRCTDPHGKVVFQDKPCPSSSVTKTIKPSMRNTAASPGGDILLTDVTFAHKAFTIGLPKRWQVTVRQANSSAASTIRATSEQGDPILLLMSFLLKRQSVGMDTVVLDRIMQGIHEQHSANPDEQRVASIPINPVFLKAWARC